VTRKITTRGFRGRAPAEGRAARVIALALVSAVAWAGLVPGAAVAGEKAGGSRSGTAVALLAPADVAFKCAAAKQKAALRRLNAINACMRRPAQLGGQTQNPNCIDKAKARFEREYATIEARGGCLPTTGDQPIVAGIADECALKLTIALPGSCQAAGDACGGSNPPCCDGLVCKAVIGQSPRCG
jgi:hypothetical protein